MYPCLWAGKPACAGCSLKLGLCCCSCFIAGAGCPNLPRKLPANTTNKCKHPASCWSSGGLLESQRPSFFIGLTPLTSSSRSFPLQYIALSTRLRMTSPHKFPCCILVNRVCFPGGHGVRWCRGGADRAKVRRVPSLRAGPGLWRHPSWHKPMPWGACKPPRVMS